MKRKELHFIDIEVEPNDKGEIKELYLIDKMVNMIRFDGRGVNSVVSKKFVDDAIEYSDVDVIIKATQRGMILRRRKDGYIERMSQYGRD